MGITAVFAQDKYAVLIGVESYDQQYFNLLDYAEDDAVELGSSLERLGFDTQVMTSQARNSRFKPTSPQKILQALQTQMNSCVEGDTILVSLSGHGLQFPDESPDEDGVRETYFCPEDASPEDKSTLLPISDVIQLMRQCDASRKLLLIDACRNNFESSAGRQKSGNKIQLASVHETRRTIPGGMTVLFSCDQDQYSWEHEDLGHSVFSFFVIDYLNGKAESHFYDQDQINLDNLTRYVRKRTNEYVSKNNLSAAGQSPVLSGSGSDWVIGQTLNPIRLILERHVDWLGGANRLKQVNQYRFTGSLIFKTKSGSDGRLDVTYFGKNKNTAFVYSHNGKVTSKSMTTPSQGWTEDHLGTRTELSSSDNWGNQMMMRYPFSAAEFVDRIDEFKIGKRQTIGDVEATELIQTDGDANTIYWYFADDGRLLKLVSEVSGEVSEFHLDNFKEYSGIKVPLRELTYTDGVLKYRTELADVQIVGLSN